MTADEARAAAIEAVERVRLVVDAQAEDDGLWFIARTAPEGYLQQELRKLHAVVEDALNVLREKRAALGGEA